MNREEILELLDKLEDTIIPVYDDDNELLAYYCDSYTVKNIIRYYRGKLSEPN